MENNPQFCPKCGTPLVGKSMCKRCGFSIENNNKKSKKNKEMKDAESLYNNKFIKIWKPIEKPVILLGSHAWIITIAISLIFLIFGIIRIFILGRWYILIVSLISLTFSILTIKSFSEKVKDKDWYYIVNNVWMLGQFRIPKILVFGLLIDIFLLGFGGLFILFPAIAIIFFGPIPFQFNIYKTKKIDISKNRIKKPEKTKKIKKSKKKIEKAKKEKKKPEKTEKTKKLKKKPEKQKKKTVVKSELKTKPFSSLNTEQRHRLYNKETGKDANYHGNITNIFKNWEKSKLDKEN